MRIGVLGTGMVGKAIATRLGSLGHDVCMGSRTADNAEATVWAAESGGRHGTFADAAAFGELAFNCTAGAVSLDVLAAAGAESLDGKILVDVSNPLDFSAGMPPSLTVCNTDSLGEQIQRSFPGVRVVKALNTMNCHVMVDPARVPGEHDVFVCGNDSDAKQQVSGVLESFGWPAGRIVDLGGIEAARGTEMYLPLWLTLLGALGTPDFNVRIVR